MTACLGHLCEQYANACHILAKTAASTTIPNKTDVRFPYPLQQQPGNRFPAWATVTAGGAWTKRLTASIGRTGFSANIDHIAQREGSFGDRIPVQFPRRGP